YLSSRLTVCLGIGGLQLRAWSAGAASCGSRYVHQGCQSLPATANSSGLSQPPCVPPNMGASEGGRNQRTQPALSRGRLLPCGAVGPSQAQQNCVLCSLGGAGMRSLFPLPVKDGEKMPTREDYLIRVQVTARHSTRATQPDRSTASLLLTVMLPE